MSTIYSMVHHEMIGPLKSNEESAVRLIRQLKDPDLRQHAQIILICSKQVLLHANDMLDQKLLQNGRFVPVYKPGSVFKALYEIAKIGSLTIKSREIDVAFNLSRVHRKYPVLSFDKRRLQQVLYNLVNNAIKFTRKGTISITGDVRSSLEDPS